MKSKLKKIGMIALFLVTGGTDQVVNLMNPSKPKSGETKAQVQGNYKLSQCMYRAGGMIMGHKCTYNGEGCNVYNNCG